MWFPVFPDRAAVHALVARTVFLVWYSSLHLFIKADRYAGAPVAQSCMHISFLTSRKMGTHIHLRILLLHYVWQGVESVTSYCHKDLLSVNYTKQKELLAGILQHLTES